MIEKFKKGLDETFQGIKTAASKVTLKAEEQTKLTKMNMKIKTLKKDLDGVMARLGNRLYTFRDEQHPERIFQDGLISEILDEADILKEKVISLQEEMDRIREDYEMRIKGLAIPEEAETSTGEEEEARSEKMEKERKIS